MAKVYRLDLVNYRLALLPLQTMESTRQKKVARLIQKELAEYFLRESKRLFDGAFITVTVVRTSPDLGHAKA